MKFVALLLLSLTVAAQVATYGFTKTVTTAGTAVTLTSTKTLCRWATVQALSTNTGYICIGGSDVTCASNKGIRLATGQALSLDAIGEAKDTNRYDLSKVYIDSTVNAEGVQVTYAQ